MTPFNLITSGRVLFPNVTFSRGLQQILLGGAIQHYIWIHRPQWSSSMRSTGNVECHDSSCVQQILTDNPEHAPENNTVPSLTYPDLCSKSASQRGLSWLLYWKQQCTWPSALFILYLYSLLFYSTHFHLLDYTLLYLFLPSLACKVQDRRDFVLYTSVLSKLVHCLVHSRY